MAQVIKHVEKFQQGGSLTINGKKYTAEQVNEYLSAGGFDSQERASLAGVVSAIQGGKDRYFDVNANSLSGEDVNSDFEQFFGSERKADKGKSGWTRKKANRHARRNTDFHVRDVALSKLGGIESFFASRIVAETPEQSTQQVSQQTSEAEVSPVVETIVENPAIDPDPKADPEDKTGFARYANEDGTANADWLTEFRKTHGDGDFHFNDSYIAKYGDSDLNGYFLIDGKFYKGEDAKDENSELYKLLRQENGFYDLNKSGNWEEADKIIKQLWNGETNLSTGSDFTDYNAVLNTNPDNRWKSLTGMYALDPLLGSQIIAYYNPQGTVNEFGFVTPQYITFDDEGNRTGWLNELGETVGTTITPLTGRKVIKQSDIDSTLNKYTYRDDNGNLIYTGNIRGAEATEGYHYKFPTEISNILNKYPEMWYKLSTNEDLMRSFQRVLGRTLNSDLRYGFGRDLSYNEWLELIGNEKDAKTLFNYYRIKGTRDGNMDENRLKWLIPSNKKGGILKGQKGLDHLLELAKKQMDRETVNTIAEWDAQLMGIDPYVKDNPSLADLFKKNNIGFTTPVTKTDLGVQLPEIDTNYVEEVIDEPSLEEEILTHFTGDAQKTALEHLQNAKIDATGAGNLVGKADPVTFNSGNLIRLYKLANAFRADKQQRELAAKVRDTALTAMESNVPEFYSRYQDYGIMNNARKVAETYRKPLVNTNSDAALMYAVQNDRLDKANQTEWQGIQQASQLYGKWLDDVNNARKTYAERRNAVDTQNRHTWAQAQAGYLNSLAASVAQRQNLVDNFATEQLALYNQDRQMNYNIASQNQQMADQLELSNLQAQLRAEIPANMTEYDYFKLHPERQQYYNNERLRLIQNSQKSGLDLYKKYNRQSPISMAKKGGSVYQRKPVSESIWEDNNKEAQKAVRQLSKQAFEFLKMALK